jgi:hypothetical protein
MIMMKKESAISNVSPPIAAKLFRLRYCFSLSRCPTILSPSFAVVPQNLRHCAALRAHSRQSMRSRSVDILEILPHLVRTVAPQDMHLLGWCHVPGDKDPREIVVMGPVLHAFKVGGRIRATNHPINVSFDATTLSARRPMCITQPQGVFQLY